MNHQVSGERTIGPAVQKKVTRAAFAAGLADLRVACGKPSYDTLARLSRRLRRSTIFDALTGRSTPSLEFVVDYVRTCLAHAEQIAVTMDPNLSDLDTWTSRWRTLHDVPDAAKSTGITHVPEPDVGPRRWTAAGWPIPRQLPPGNGLLMGRDDELGRLDSVLEGGLIVVTGMVGVGKTALVSHWARERSARFPDGQLWVGPRPAGNNPSLAATLVSLLCALGLDRYSLPDSVTDLSHLLRSCTADRKVVLIVDNADDPEHVRPLLPAAAHCATIVTSRRGLVGLSAREGASRLIVPPLTSAAAARLLIAVLRSTKPDSELDARMAHALATLCGGLPLALRAVAERLRWENAAQLHEELCCENQLLSGLDVADDPESSPRTVIVSSINQLPASTAKALRLLTLHPGTTCTAASAAALLGSTQAEAQREIRSLVQDNLLEHHEGSHFRLHGLVRLAASEARIAVDHPDEQRDALRRLLSWFRNNSVSSPWTGAEEVDPLQGSIDTTGAIAWLSAQVSLLRDGDDRYRVRQGG